MTTCEVCGAPDHADHWATMRAEMDATKASCRALVDELNALLAEVAKGHEAVAVYEAGTRPSINHINGNHDEEEQA